VNREQSTLPLVDRIEFAAVATAPGLARVFVQQTLQEWGLSGLADSAALIASELVTNAVEATGTIDPHPSYADLADLAVVGVQLQVEPHAMRIAVSDNSDRPPAPAAPRDDAEGGRGLLLVEALSARWGVHRSPVGGKVVWSELVTPAGFMTAALHGSLPQAR
jgi:anti-sigma regulatory factor (Ser/Thr protein kinase)